MVVGNRLLRMPEDSGADVVLARLHQLFQRQALADHHNKLRERLGLSGPFPSQLAPFEEAMKNKRTIASLQDAVDTVLAHAKITANETADRMDANLKTLRGSPDASLFPDAEGLAVKEPADLAEIMRGRIAKAKEEADRQERLRKQAIEEAARARIQAEREAKEAAFREQQRKENEVLDAQAILDRFVERFGHIQRFAPVVEAIAKVVLQNRNAA